MEPPHFSDATKFLLRWWQVWKKRHFVLKFRGSLGRVPQQRGLVSLSSRLPFKLERSTRPCPALEGICKGKISNHDSKAKWLLKLERTNTNIRERERDTKHSCTKDWGGASFTGPCRPAFAFYWAGSFTSEEVLETKQEQHLGQEGSRPPASAWTLPAVFPGTNRVPADSTCGYCWSATTSILRIFWSSHEGTVRVFHMIWDSLAKPSGFWVFWERRWITLGSPTNTQKSSMSVLDGQEINQWTQGLYPSTINKVHHEWRLWGATHQRPRYGRYYPHHLLRGWWIISFSQNAGCWGFHYCFVSLVLWNF